MSLLVRGSRSCRFFFQLEQNNISPLPRNRPVNLGLQSDRPLRSPCALHGSCFSPFTAASFSPAAEAASMAAPSTHSEDIDPHKENESESAKAVASDSDQEDAALRKAVKERRQLFTALQAELEKQRASINLVLEEVRALKAHQEAEVEARKVSVELRQPWLEWNAFMEYLQSAGFFKGEVKASDTDTVLKDPVCVKKAIYKFSLAKDAIYGSLSQMDLRILAHFGSTGNDPKAAASQAKLCQFFQAEDEVSNLNTARPALPQPRLADVTRLILSTVSAFQEGIPTSDVKFSIVHLLREMASLSSVRESPVASSHDVISASPIRASDLLENPKQEIKKTEKGEKKQDLSKVKTGKNEDAMTKSSGRAETQEVTTKPKQWKCPRCSFKNLDSKHRCVECSRRRPQSTYTTSTVNKAEESSDDELLKLLDDDEKSKKAHGSSKEDSPLKRQDCKSSKGKSLVREHEDTDMEASDTECDVRSEETKGGVDSDNDVDILDDILNSEDSEDEPQGRGRRVPLSDVSDDEPKANGKKACLSKLVPKKPGAPTKRGGLGRSSQKWPPKKGRRHDEDDDDEEGYASVEDDKPLNKGADRFERRGHLRGLGTGRSDSYNDRGGARGYGDRDRGYVDRDGGYGGRDSGSRGLRGTSRQ